MTGLSDVLFAACGVNRPRWQLDQPGITAASASNSQEIDVYVALREAPATERDTKVASPMQAESVIMESQQSFTDSPVGDVRLLAARVQTIREMLASLNTLTNAGQQHLMNRVVDFVGAQVQQACRGAGSGNRRMLLEQLDLLQREARRRLPSVSAFRPRAENLLQLLNSPA